MRISRQRIGTILSVAYLALALGCSTAPPDRSAPPSAPTPELMPLPAPAPDGLTRVDRFCGALQRVVDAEAAGFSALRGEQIGRRAWRGRVVPVGFQACAVEGDYHPGAEYVCRGQAIRGGGASLLEADFARLAGDLDACLARGVWFPRNWQSGEVMRFAGGERQQMWRDLAPMPKPALALKIEEDFQNRVYYIRFAAFTLR